MKNLRVKKYIGDKELAFLLDGASYEVSVELIKACILGIQSSLSKSGLSSVLDLISGGNKRTLSPDIVMAVEGLWYHLRAASDFNESEHAGFDGNRGERGAYVAYIGRQIQAGEEFLKRLHLGGYGREGARNEAAQRLYGVFINNMELLRALETSMKEKWSDEDFADMDGFTQKLERFTLVMWRTMVSIKNASKREMLERLKNKAIIEKIEEQLGAPIRRNDSCPCGSGKKYKYCCGS